jgi:hypothetical protein
MKVRNIEFEGTPYNEQTYNWRTIPSELTTEQKLALLEAMGIPVKNTFVKVRDNEFVINVPICEFIERG